MLRYYTRITSYKAALWNPRGNHTQGGHSLVVLLQNYTKGNKRSYWSLSKGSHQCCKYQILENLTIQEWLDLKEVMCAKEV